MSMGYDRALGVGDVKWTDYEVTVPITILRLMVGPATNQLGTGLGNGSWGIKAATAVGN